MISNNNKNVKISYDEIYKVISENRIDKLRELLSKGINVNGSRYNLSLIDVAIILGRNSALNVLLDYMDINAKNRLCGDTPLQVAICSNNREAVEILLKKSINIHAKNKFGNTALHLAVIRGYEDIVSILIIAGANVDASNNFGLTPMHYACSYRNANMVRILLRNGANYIKKDLFGINAKYIATRLKSDDNIKGIFNSIMKNEIEEVNKMYIKKGVNIETSDNIYLYKNSRLRNLIDVNMGYLRDEMLPLHLAVKSNNKDLVKLLINMGADVNKRIKGEFMEEIEGSKGNGTIRVKEQSPLYIAIREGNADMVELLLKHGACIEDRACIEDDVYEYDPEDCNFGGINGYGYKARINLFTLAAGISNENVVKSLLKYGADINMSNDYGLKPLLMSAIWDNELVFKFLVERGAEYDVNGYFYSPLHWAVNSNNKNMVNYLIQKGFNINEQGGGEGGDTVLYHAVLMNYDDIAYFLLSKGADPNIGDEAQYRALHFAALKGNIGLVKKLVQQGADINIKDTDRYENALMWALRGMEQEKMASYKEVIFYLVDNGIDLNKGPEDYQSTPLFRVLTEIKEKGYDWKEIATYLVNKGAEVNARGEGEITVFDYAVGKEDFDIIRFLIENAAISNIENMELLDKVLNLINDNVVEAKKLYYREKLNNNKISDSLISNSQEYINKLNEREKMLTIIGKELKKNPNTTKEILKKYKKYYGTVIKERIIVIREDFLLKGKSGIKRKKIEEKIENVLVNNHDKNKKQKYKE